MTTIFTARKIVTMNPANPEVRAVAVRTAGSSAPAAWRSVQSWGEATVDERFGDHVLVPGSWGRTATRSTPLAEMMPFSRLATRTRCPTATLPIRS